MHFQLKEFVNLHLKSPQNKLRMKQITHEQRYQIEAFLKAKMSIVFIADYLGKHPSNIRRELNRNGQKRGVYKAKHAIMLSKERKDRYNVARKFTDDVKNRVCHYIEQEQWSPEQIVGHCKKNNIPIVSHERIYQFIRKEKSLGGQLYTHLRHKLKHRKRPVGRFIPIKNRVSIDQRPEIVDKKERFGDWEIDTIIGKDGKGAIVTIVERTTAMLMMRKLTKGKDAKALADTVIQMLLPYKNSILTITSDNGTEFAEHQKIASKLEANFYFADPYSSWQRGLNEYTNKLIRQYIPKKTDFANYNNIYITETQHKINKRPRENLEFDSPKNLFYKLVS
jgi:IS30 family transposase